MIRRKGFAIVMSSLKNPRTPNGFTMFFGPTASRGVSYASENICQNGFHLFRNKKRAIAAIEERRGAFKGEFDFVRLVAMEMHIAENRDEREMLRSFGSYILAYGENLNDTALYGKPWVDGVRVHTAHDSWAHFTVNGARPFTSFRSLVGESSLGTISEIIRQGGGGQVFLIGIKIHWRVKQ